MQVMDRKLLNLLTKDPDIEIILMDIQLPVMDGYTSAKKIRELRKEVKLIAQTAYSFA